MTLEEYEKVNPIAWIEHEDKKVLYAVPNNACLWRVKTLHQKEPCTIEWIKGFDPGDTLIDIGANVGMYTIWAAVTKGVTVFAFEPEAGNYALLNKNILINGLADRVRAFCIGLSDVNGFTALNLSNPTVGRSGHAVGEAIDQHGNPFESPFIQGCISWRLDDVIQMGAIPVPTHIKIDVDGIEPKIIAGAVKTLANPKLKSLLIETNPALDTHKEMVATIETAGFHFDPEQVRLATRTEGPFQGVAEHIFTR